MEPNKLRQGQIIKVKLVVWGGGVFVLEQSSTGL